MKLSHEVLLALAYVSQISDPDSVKLRFIESLNRLDAAFSFEFVEYLPPGVPEYRVLPITTLRSSFGYALIAESPETSEAERAVFRTAFQFLAVILENRIQAQTLESKNISLLREINQEKSMVHTILNTLPVGVWVADENGTILLGNAAGKEIWAGIRYIGIGQYGEYKAWWPDTGKRIEPEEWSITRAIKAGETSIDQEVKIECFDGTHKTILVSAAPLLDDEQRVIGAVAVNQDITARKRAEEGLTRSEALLNASLEQSPVGVIIADVPNLKIKVVNEAFQDLFGIQDEQTEDVSLIGYKPSWKTFRPDGTVYLNIADTPLYKAISGKTVKGEEVHIVRKDGTERFASCNGTSIYNKMGKVIAAFVVYVDITDKRMLENKLQQAHKMEAIGTLAGGIAHDFNNILGIILGNTELALDDVPDWNPARQNLDEVVKACLRAKDVVRQILSFSRQSKFELKPVNIASVVTETLKLLRASIPTIVEIRKNIRDDVDAILGDATQLHQIIINLCTNAAHAMEEKGGILNIALGNIAMDADAASKYDGLNPGRYVKLEVSDTGEGIDPKLKDRIFDPYFTTKDVGKGTGMGLAVVHGIVKGHKGMIAVESEPGKGTLFRLFFPAVDEGPVEQKKRKENLSTGDERILFVDDEESMVNLNHQRLERLGYKVTPQTDPSEALEFFRANPDQIDLVITDMTMPHMTGDRLAEEILKIRSDMPIIICTGYSSRISKETARELGIRKYIEKPIEMEKLALSVREVLDEK